MYFPFMSSVNIDEILKKSSSIEDILDEDNIANCIK